MSVPPGTFDWQHMLYRFFDADGGLLYVGMTNNPSVRWPEHHVAVWWPLVGGVTVEFLPDRKALADAERLAIRTEGPIYNVKGNEHRRRRKTEHDPRTEGAGRRLARIIEISDAGTAALDALADQCGYGRADIVKLVLRFAVQHAHMWRPARREPVTL